MSSDNTKIKLARTTGLGPFDGDNFRYDYPSLTPDSVVIDCGGYEGRWALGMIKKFGCHVTVYEPVKKYFEQTAEALRPFPRAKVLNVGVSDHAKTVQFGVKGDMAGQYTDHECEEYVELIGIREVLDKPENSVVDVLKLNIEGSEFDVLEMMYAHQLMGRVKNIQVQWHGVPPRAHERYDALQKALEETHYLTYYDGWIWQNWRINDQV